MTFLAPYLLWGALAGGIPIALHFFYRSRYRTVAWAAMQFLLTSIEQTSRRLRFQEILLLALRVTLLVLLALALARPSTTTGHGSGSGEAIDAVLLLDNSFSMAARDGNAPLREVGSDPYLATLKSLAAKDGTVTRMDRARAAALAVIDSLPPGSTVQVLTCSDRANLLGPQAPAQLDQARELVRQVRVSDLATDLMPGVLEADAVLQRGHSPNKELYLFSDMQRLGWEQQGSSLAARLKEVRQRAALHFVHCGTRTPANAAIVGITPQSSLRVGERADFAVLVRNTGKQELRNLTVTLEVDGRKDERDSRPLERIAPGSTEDVVLSVLLEQPGRRALTARVAADDLDADNRFDQVIHVRDEVGILIVDGGLVETDDRQSDSFRLRLALAPFPSQAVAPDRVSPKMLANKDLCILVNVALEPTAKKDTRVLLPEFVDALAGFVRDGHSVIVFGGPNVAPKAYNRLLYQQHRILPFPITAVSSSTPPDRPLSFDRQSAAASPFLKLREEYYSGAEQGRVLRWLELLEGDRPEHDAQSVWASVTLQEGERPDDESRVLLRYSNGQAAIASRRKAGEGEVLLVTTAVHDRTAGKGTAPPEWTDWYTEPRLWVPLIQMTANHLLESQPRQYNRIAGQPLRWGPPRSDAESSFDLILPDGTPTRLGFPETVEGRPLLIANDTQRAGVYHVARTDRAPLGDEPPGLSRRDGPAGEYLGTPFAVVPDLRESEDLASLQPKELDEMLGFQAVHLLAGDDGGVFSAAERLKREWTVWLLVLLLVLVIGEAVLAWYCGRAW